MAVINPPAWMQAGSYPARTDRLAISALLGYPGFLVDEATPLRIRQGVKPSYTGQQLKARAAGTPNMTVLVSAGFCVIDNHDSGGAGTYVCVNDSDVTLTITPAGGAGQFRKDAVVASVYDAETAGVLSEWRLEVIQGAYAASAGAAVRPTVPSNAQLIADVAVGASVTSVSAANITDTRQFTTSLGGILPVASSAMPNRPHPGQVMYQTNTDTFMYGKQDGSTAALLDSAGASTIGKALFARKTADTARATATVTNDPHLVVTLAANAVYRLEATLFVATTDATNADVSVQWALPGSTTASWTFLGQGTAATSGTGTLVTQAFSGSTVGMGAIVGADLAVMASGLVVTDSSGGTFALAWARTGASGTATLRANSHMVMTRVA